MGWNQVRFEIIGHTSSHNSEQDDKDEADWDEFRHRIELICREHRYADLDIQII